MTLQELFDAIIARFNELIDYIKKALGIKDDATEGDDKTDGEV